MTVASIGGFDLGYSGERFGKDGYRYTTMLVCTGAETEIELLVTTTPLGAISRLNMRSPALRTSGTNVAGAI